MFGRMLKHSSAFVRRQPASEMKRSGIELRHCGVELLRGQITQNVLLCRASENGFTKCSDKADERLTQPLSMRFRAHFGLLRTSMSSNCCVMSGTLT
ncbi:MAG: hypothetical protein K2O65_06850, partial [Lachnospiraceae bacterium]|nr:hypothetical protein [Lachnospiraceae bacterium]